MVAIARAAAAAPAPVLEPPRSRLRFLTCGSVDDGKSTLIGRLLYESKLLFEDQIVALRRDSKKSGTQNGEMDFSLLVDGLTAEREQGITIDVAYRYFSTGNRSFTIADTPGHEQYTRNMATAASVSDVAVILIDARKGVLTQTRRHSFIVSMLGIKHVILAVNKMDLVGYAQPVFKKIEAEYRAFAAPLGFKEIACLPISALHGDNLVARSASMPWYAGPALLSHLESVEVEEDLERKPFRMPVQWVNRAAPDFRGYSGMVASGAVWVGDRVRVLPGGRETRVRRIVTFDGDLDHAVAGQSVTLVLADEVDVSRGDVLCTAAEPARTADRFEAKLLWMAEPSLQPGRRYLCKIGARTVPAVLSPPDHAIDVNTLGVKPAATLGVNDIGQCGIALDAPVAFDAFAENRETGSFIVIDRATNQTVALGLLLDAIGAERGRAPWLLRLLPPLLRRNSAARPYERGWRSFVKALSWRSVGTLDTLLLAYIFTGNAAISFAISGTEIATKTVLYYGHERVWARVRAGISFLRP